MSSPEMREGPFTINGPVLILHHREIAFAYDIRTAERLGDLLIVLLSIPFDEHLSRNLYALNTSGDLLWQAEDPGIWVKNPLPFENLFVDAAGTIRASDFYGRAFLIDYRDGHIINMESGK